MRSTAELQEIESVDSLFTDIYIILYFSIISFFFYEPIISHNTEIFHSFMTKIGFFIRISQFFSIFLFYF